MDPREINEYLRSTPFEPFRVHMSDGSYHDVRHPEMAMLSTTRLWIVKEATEEGIARRVATLSPMHVNWIEPLEHAEAS